MAPYRETLTAESTLNNEVPPSVFDARHKPKATEGSLRKDLLSALFSSSATATFPSKDDEGHRIGGRLPPLGRHEAAPPSNLDLVGNDPARDPLFGFLQSMAIGEDTAKAAVATALLFGLGYLARRSRVSVSIAIKPEHKELWANITKALGKTTTALTVASAGTLTWLAQSDFANWVDEARSGNIPEAQRSFDAMFAKLIALGAIGASYARPLGPADHKVFNITTTGKADGSIAPAVNGVAQAESKLPLVPTPTLPANVPTGELFQRLAPMMQALTPILNEVGAVLADERGSIRLAFFEGNFTTRLITLGKVFRWLPPLWEHTRLDKLTKTINRGLQNKYPGMPGLKLYEVEDSSIYVRPFDQRTFLVPVEIEAPLNNLAHRYWGYVCARAEQSWLIAQYMAKVQRRSAGSLERVFSPELVEAALRNTDPMNPQDEIRAKALSSMSERELEREARHAGAQAEANYWANQPRRWFDNFDPLPGFDD